MPRHKMPDGLYVSISQVKCFLRCPRQFELKYVRGLTPEFVPANLVFGSAIHEALAAYYGELKTTGEPLRRDLMLDVFRGAWGKRIEGDVPVQGDDDEDGQLSALVDKGVSMLHAFHEHAAHQILEVESVEHPFEIEIHDPDTGEVLDEKLVGFIDLVAVENGRRVIYEHKTSAKKYTTGQLKHDPQVTAYRMAMGMMGKGDVGMKFQVLTKTKVPAIQIAEVERTAQDEEDLLRTVQGVLRSVDAGVSYPLRGWQCRSCPYQAGCGGRGAS
jgi:putative RecB family exonuclease